MPLCVGLTGGIASGKTTVARHFAELGSPVIDADQVARDVVVPGSKGLAAVISQFGPDYLASDGSLDRRKLRVHVFADASQRQQLEGILHPLIRQALLDWRESLSAPYGILMAPIMREAGFHTLVDRVAVVDTSREAQKTRLMSRDEVDEALAEQMLQAQADRQTRLAYADDIIDNSGSPSALSELVRALHKKYLNLALGAKI